MQRLLVSHMINFTLQQSLTTNEPTHRLASLLVGQVGDGRVTSASECTCFILCNSNSMPPRARFSASLHGCMGHRSVYP